MDLVIPNEAGQAQIKSRINDSIEQKAALLEKYKEKFGEPFSKWAAENRDLVVMGSPVALEKKAREVWGEV